MSAEFLPYARQTIDADDIAAVTAVLQGEYLTTGPAVAAFERAFAAQVDAKYAVACANGTAALHLADLAAGVGPGDVVISSTLTFLATANAARYAGAEVVFADCDPETALTRPGDIEDAIRRCDGRRIAAIHVVHMCGQACDLEAIRQIAVRVGAVLVEDACHALGTSYATRDGGRFLVGSCAHSDMACFSMHPTKTITMGEGGVVTTNSADLYERLLSLRAHGYVRDPVRFKDPEAGLDETGAANPWYYEMQELGFNYRATDIQCALGLSQLKRLGAIAQRRRELAKRYRSALHGLSQHLRPVPEVATCSSVLHLFPVLIDFDTLGKSRSRVMQELRQAGIGTQVHYRPVHRQPYYAERYGPSTLAGAEDYYRRTLSLPFFAGMSDDDQDRVVVALGDVLGRA